MNARRTQRALISAMAITSACFAGCGGGGAPAVPTGPLSVDWVIGGSGCNGSGLETVEITISDVTGPVNSANVACQVLEYTFPAVPEGRYRVDILGFREESGTAAYQGYTPLVDVRAGVENTAPTVKLSQKPGSLDVVWFFENSRLCSSNRVESVEISIWDGASNQVVFESFPCDSTATAGAAPDPQAAPPTDTIPSPFPEPAATAEGVLIEDLAAGTYTVEARALSASSSIPSFWATAKTTIKLATKLQLELELASCEDKPSNLCKP